MGFHASLPRIFVFFALRGQANVHPVAQIDGGVAELHSHVGSVVPVPTANDLGVHVMGSPAGLGQSEHEVLADGMIPRRDRAQSAFGNIHGLQGFDGATPLGIHTDALKLGLPLPSRMPPSFPRASLAYR